MTLPALSKDMTAQIGGVDISKIRSGSVAFGKNIVPLDELGNNWSVSAPGMKNISITLELMPITSNTQHNAFWTSYFADTPATAALSSFQITIDATTVIHCDTDTDSEAYAYVSDVGESYTIGESVVDTFTITFSGAVARDSG